MHTGSWFWFAPVFVHGSHSSLVTFSFLTFALSGFHSFSFCGSSFCTGSLITSLFGLPLRFGSPSLVLVCIPLGSRLLDHAVCTVMHSGYSLDRIVLSSFQFSCLASRIAHRFCAASLDGSPLARSGSLLRIALDRSFAILLHHRTRVCLMVAALHVFARGLRTRAHSRIASRTPHSFSLLLILFLARSWITHPRFLHSFLHGSLHCTHLHGSFFLCLFYLAVLRSLSLRSFIVHSSSFTGSVHFVFTQSFFLGSSGLHSLCASLVTFAFTHRDSRTDLTVSFARFTSGSFAFTLSLRSLSLCVFSRFGSLPGFAPGSHRFRRFLYSSFTRSCIVCTRFMDHSLYGSRTHHSFSHRGSRSSSFLHSFWFYRITFVLHSSRISFASLRIVLDRRMVWIFARMDGWTSWSVRINSARTLVLGSRIAHSSPAHADRIAPASRTSHSHAVHSHSHLVAVPRMVCAHSGCASV